MMAGDNNFALTPNQTLLSIRLVFPLGHTRLSVYISKDRVSFHHNTKQIYAIEWRWFQYLTMGEAERGVILTVCLLKQSTLMHSSI